MSEPSDLPNSGTAEPTPQSYDEQVAAISDLLEDPPADPPEDDQDQAKAEPAQDDDPLALEDSEAVETNDDDDPDGPDEAEVKGGRFAPDSAKVKLDSGETISIADLKVRVEKRVKDFQRGFTEKQQKLSAKEAEVDQFSQSLNQEREYVLWYAEQHLPKQPQPFHGDAATDPVGFGIWQQNMRRWEEHVQAYQAFKAQQEADNQHKSQETKAQHDARVEAEYEALKSALPVLKNPSKVKPFFDALMAGAAQHYGLEQQDMLNAIAGNHKVAVIMRDALAYRQIKAKAPQVRDEVQRRPPTTGGRRGDPRAQVNRDRQVRTERLRQTGDFDAGVASLMDLDL